MIWLSAAALSLTVALLVAASRSGMVGLTAGFAVLLALSRLRMKRRHVAGLSVALVLALVVVAAYVLNLSALASRFDETLREGLGGRRAIWRETWPMLADFWRTGIGFGAYGRGMLVYQQSPRETYFNHAHNEYLQLAVEGGLLFGVPAAIAVVLYLRELVRQLNRDRSAMFWARAGAVAGLCAVAAQSVWEVGLRVPANGIVFVILTAIAVHDPIGSRRAEG
jgi:O-antigen ligase